MSCIVNQSIQILIYLLLEQGKKLFLTHEKQIRAYPQFKDATEEEIINMLILHQLALIIYELAFTRT